MKERIAKVFEQVGLAVRSNPVELIICLFGFIICCLTYEMLIIVTGKIGRAHV